MPTIQPYQPGKLASPLVGVAGKSSQGEAQREHAGEIDQTKRALEQQRGQELQDTTELHGTELRDATEQRGQILQGASELRGAQMKGQTEVAGGAIRGFGQVVGSGLEIAGKRAFYAQQAQQQNEQRLKVGLAQGEATADATKQAQTAQQLWDQVKNGPEFANDPQTTAANFQNLIAHNNQLPDGSYQFVDSEGNRLDTEHLTNKALANTNDPDAPLTSQRLNDRLLSSNKTLADNAVSQAYNQATKNTDGQVQLAGQVMQTQISQYVPQTLNDAFDNAYKAMQPVAQMIDASSALRGVVQQKLDLADLHDKAGKAVILGAINNASKDAMTRLAQLNDIQTFLSPNAEGRIGQLPAQPNTLRGMVSARPDYSEFTISDAAHKDLQSTVTAKRNDTIKDIQRQDLLNDQNNADRANQLQLQITQNNGSEFVQTQAKQAAAAKVKLLIESKKGIENDPRLASTPELKASRLKSADTQIAAYEAVMKTTNANTRTDVAAAKASEKQVATVYKAEKTATQKQVEKTTTLSLDAHLAKFQELTSDPTQLGANMDKVHDQAVAFMKENLAAHQLGTITNTQYKSYYQTALTLAGAAATWIKGQDHSVQIVGTNWGIGAPKAATPDNKNWKIKADAAKNAILVELNKWDADKSHRQYISEALNATPEQRDKITDALNVWSKNHGGAAPNDAQRSFMTSYVIKNTPRKIAEAPHAHAGRNEPPIKVPPPPPTAKSFLQPPEPAEVTQAELDESDKLKGGE